MGQTLYLECSSGISGDMTVAALLDLGADEQVLRNVLKTIPDQSFSVEISRVKKSGIECCDFLVRLDEGHENHDHDMEYLHGHEKVYCHEHAAGHHHEYEEEHCHEHEEEHYHEHVHRGLAEIEEMIYKCEMTEHARELALKIFRILGEAEAKAHGVPIEQVHFHEVGAVDSIVDIVSAAVCLDNLRIENVIIPRLCEGSGTIRCQHGILPVPVPAVANIIEMYNIKLHIMELKGEFVTPTGAAIAAAVMTSDRLPEEFQIQKTGLGAGKRTYERPSILRAILIEG